MAENAYDFDVFSEQDLALPTTPIAVLDLNGSLTRFLKKHGIDVVRIRCLDSSIDSRVRHQRDAEKRRRIKSVSPI